MPKGGQLTISDSLSADGKRIEVRFADSGVGIPRENVNKLFDPFFTTKSTGTGLGLASATGYPAARWENRGQERSRPGNGLYPQLPVEDIAQIQRPQEELMSNRNKRRILVVDDEITVCKSIRQAIVSDEYEVDMALSGEEALKKDEEKPYDLIITT